MKKIDFEKYSFKILERMMYCKRFFWNLSYYNRKNLIIEYCARIDDKLLCDYLD